jgi:hypothetical protein
LLYEVSIDNQLNARRTIMKAKNSPKKPRNSTKTLPRRTPSNTGYETRFFFLGHKVFDEIKTLARLAAPAPARGNGN